MKRTLLIFAIFALTIPLHAGKKNSASTHVNLDTGTIIGKQIPWLELEAYHNGKISKISLADYRGKWIILFFYPADFTFVCPTELKELSDYQKDFDDSGAIVLSVSTDTAYVHRAWQKDNQLLKNVRFPMLSDRAGVLSRSLGVYNSSTGNSVRAVFIVDPEGRIAAAEYTHDSIGRNAGEILRKLDAAIAVQSGGGLCPAGWKEGDQMIKNTEE